mmetsp:Transcript_4953/g.7413  ORF Transcript_4953/g.7413 Transcript_4953/m.7413 type:complete len:401 (+) Transcript_4953:25-1227(+)
MLRLAAIVALAYSASALSVVTPENDDQFPLFTIDYDTKPRDRFKEVSTHYRDNIVEVFNVAMDEIPNFVSDFFKLVHGIWWVLHHEKYEELLGIVDAVNHPNVTISNVVMVNCLYELEGWCTSIIAKQTNGTILHSRNLDFHIQQMRDNTYRARFTKGGNYLYDAVMFAGNVGVYTGMKEGAFSISQNTRAPNKHYVGVIENLIMLFTGFREQSWIIRDSLESCGDWDCAYDKLRNEPFNALGYIILAGVKDDEGVVISRKRFGPAHEDFLNTTNGTWYVVQANHDHWADGCKDRCAAASESLDNLGQDALDINTLRESVLEVPPVLNKKTIYNTQFIPSLDFKNSIPLDYNETAQPLEGKWSDYKDDIPDLKIGEIFEGITYEQFFLDMMMVLMDPKVA